MAKVGPYLTDTSETLEELTGRRVDHPDRAPTPMVATILRAWKKPLSSLNAAELWLLASQGDGFPFVLDIVWPILQHDPLYCFDKYEGDLLSSLLNEPEDTWHQRPEYRAELDSLKARALSAPEYINDMFRESLE